ncbi:hypothetical protein FBUS_04106 [Fasciolopsis buskii]|uniref:Uncharacterized protein n=1 Tax=Fasciolopsis buskii TaxID=27845 RepID=A0A8E0S445_9TREM|nr:hypothetical protein FBUS_04106 [Fasciolopsis buski]
MTKFIGEWKCTECNNLDPVMIENGATQDFLNTFDTWERVLVIDIEGNEIYLRDDVGNCQVGTRFRLNKEIEEMTPDGRIVQSIITLDSDVQLTQIQRHGFHETRITRKVFGNNLTTKITAGDSVAVLKYVRIGEPKDSKQYFVSTEPNKE